MPGVRRTGSVKTNTFCVHTCGMYLRSKLSSRCNFAMLPLRCTCTWANCAAMSLQAATDCYDDVTAVRREGWLLCTCTWANCAGMSCTQLRIGMMMLQLCGGTGDCCAPALELTVLECPCTQLRIGMMLLQLCGGTGDCCAPALELTVLECPAHSYGLLWCCYSCVEGRVTAVHLHLS